MPESVSDFVQEKGRAGRYPNAHPSENRYTICFTIEDLVYVFHRTMDPLELVINESYRKRKVIDLIQMARVLASDECMNRHVERIIGNQEKKDVQSSNCGHCNVCNNDRMFPKINKNGTTTVLLDLFVFGNGNINGKPNLTALVTAFQTYPDGRGLIIAGTRSTRPFQPVEIKKILFMLVAHGMLTLQFEPNMREVIFRLAKASHNASVLAIQYHPYWVAMKTLVDVSN